nr:hemicentin-2-like [Penaeus vannamei]
MPMDKTDKPLLVLWYKESQATVPIYSYDTRSGPFDQGVRWADTGYLGTRAFFRILSDPPTLVVEDVKVADQAVYTCRVDYKIRPSAITKVNLTVIVPPGPPLILNSSGHQLQEEVGPLEEGRHTQLTCRSAGGSPTPTLTWWRDGERLNQVGRFNGQSVESRISLEATRNLHGATLTCQALNNNITEPSSTSITIKVMLRPISVEIVGDVGTLSSGRPVELVCRAVGSRPPAHITWIKGNKQVTEVRHTVSLCESRNQLFWSVSLTVYSATQRQAFAELASQALPESVSQALAESGSQALAESVNQALAESAELASQATKPGTPKSASQALSAKPLASSSQAHPKSASQALPKSASQALAESASQALTKSESQAHPKSGKSASQAVSKPGTPTAS